MGLALFRLRTLKPEEPKKLADRKQSEKDGGKQILELPELDELLRTVLSGRTRSPETLKARRYLVEQLLARGYKKAEIATRLNVTRKTVYNILNKRD